MTTHLEEQVNDSLPKYNITDIIVPLKLARHYENIIKIKNPVVKYYELSLNAILTSVQIIMYYSLHKILN